MLSPQLPLSSVSPLAAIPPLRHQPLRRSLVPHHRPLTLKGLVTDKALVDGVPQIEVDIVMENEEGTPLVIGKATVRIPERG